ncbi:MAG: DoxX family protein [Vicinamibacterales bacterium]
MRVWTGRILSGIAILFLAFDAGMKLIQFPAATAGTADLGYPVHVVLPLGVLQAVLLALYIIPRTAVLGAVLWVGYLGGAIATHVRVENPWATHILFPIYVALLLWGGLWLRDARPRAMFTGTP